MIDTIDLIFVIAMTALLCYLILTMVLSITLYRCLTPTDNRPCTICRGLIITYHKIAAFLSNGQVVILLDFKGEVKVSVAHKVKYSNNLLSYSYYNSRVGPIFLLEDGTVTTVTGLPSYILYWLPYNLEQKTFMILQQDAKKFHY